MNAPSRLNREAFKKAIADHVTECYVELDDGTGQQRYVCKHCGREVKQATAWISVHTLLFEECAGWGEIRRIPLPYCPTCEGELTETRGCIHI
jgi:hypothetical protein